MKIYKVEIKAYDYWYTTDRSGFRTVEKFFTTEEKANIWITKNPKYIYRGFNKEQTEAQEDYEMPTFKIIEIEVED